MSRRDGAIVSVVAIRSTTRDETMVARKPRSGILQDGPARGPSELFRAWRRFLANPAQMLSARRTSDAERPAAGGGEGKGRMDPNHVRREREVAFGLLALAVGTAGAIAYGVSRGRLGEAASAAALMVAWTVARLLVMREAARPLSAEQERALTQAWGTGLLPYTVAIVGSLRALAWIASLVITSLRARALGVPVTQTRRAVTWGFGLEAAALLGGYLLRNGIVILALLRG